MSEGLTSFVDAPHARCAQVELLQVLGADGVAKELAKLGAAPSPAGGGRLGWGCVERDGKNGSKSALIHPSGTFSRKREKGDHEPQAGVPLQLGLLPHLILPDHHDVRGSDVVTRRLHGNLAAAAECGPRDFTELLQVPGVGARTVRALSQPWWPIE